MTMGTRSRKTTDLTLASYLSLEGFEYDLVSDGQLPNGQPAGAWMFDPHPKLTGTIEEFRNNNAEVEPQAFHRMLSRTRKELFKFLREEPGWKDK